MQFKRQGTRIQVLAYRGYDKQKRRAIVKMQGSIDSNNYEPSDGLVDNLTTEEKIELQSFLEKERQTDLKNQRQADCDQVAQRIEAAAQNLKTGVLIDSAQAAEIWNALAVLQKALKSSGHKKPVKDKVPTPVPERNAVNAVNAVQDKAPYFINGSYYLFRPPEVKT